MVAPRGERGRGLVTAPTPVLGGDRFRRATRECLLAVAAAKAAVADAGLAEAELCGPANGYPVRERHGVRRREPGVPRGRDVHDASLPVHLAQRGARRGDDRAGHPGALRQPHGRRARRRCRRSGGRRAGWPRAAPTGSSCSPWRRFTRCGTCSAAPAGSTRGPSSKGRPACSSRPGEGSGLRWASALGGPAGSRSAVATVLERVLDGDRPGLVWSGSTGGGRESRRGADPGRPGGPGHGAPPGRGPGVRAAARAGPDRTRAARPGRGF